MDIQRKKATLAWSCDMDGPLVHSIPQQALYWEVSGFSRGQGPPRKDKLGRHIRKRPTKVETRLGRG